MINYVINHCTPLAAALGVVVSVQAEYIIVYSREGGNVYVDKSVLTTKQKFEVSSDDVIREILHLFASK